MKITQKEIAECVGLWLAEGDHKTKKEITFTNNCLELISFFHQTMIYLYGGSFNPRVYIYSKSGNEQLQLEEVTIKNYVDIRANKPYYLYRLASVKIVPQWRKLVESYLIDSSLNFDILRGFFAGEGNIKTGSKMNRMVRIAQKQPLKWVDESLSNLGVRYSFGLRDRSYNIWGRESWDKLAKVTIADLHPIKKERFWQVYNQFKEYHYSNSFLREEIIKQLIKPMETIALANIFNRKPSRVSEVLIELKKTNQIKDYRVGSKSYWIRNDQNIIIISSTKQKYLKLLNSCSKTYEFATKMQVNWKSAFRRLNELKKLGLISFKDNKWIKKQTDKKIIVK